MSKLLLYRYSYKALLNPENPVKWAKTMYLYSGRRIMIKRELFGKWLDQQTVI